MNFSNFGESAALSPRRNAGKPRSPRWSRKWAAPSSLPPSAASAAPCPVPLRTVMNYFPADLAKHLADATERNTKGPSPWPKKSKILFIRDDDEGLFSRDVDGQLVRVDDPTENDYEKMGPCRSTGQSVTVPMAEPTKDANGNIVLDVDGRTTPRFTTIYDAAVKLIVKQPGDEAKIPIPILCHQPHMKPVAVCRMCMVQIYGQKRGARAAERKLMPALPASGEGRHGSFHHCRSWRRRRSRAAAPLRWFRNC